MVYIGTYVRRDRSLAANETHERTEEKYGRISVRWERKQMTTCSRMLLVAVVSAASPVFAQNYPSRPVTVVAATTPGSLPDVLARGVGERLARKWGQSVVIENRAGGAYAVAASAVANAAADGYTLLATESGF